MGDSPAAGVTGEKIWLDGEFVDWDSARVHVLTHTRPTKTEKFCRGPWLRVAIVRANA